MQVEDAFNHLVERARDDKDKEAILAILDEYDQFPWKSDMFDRIRWHLGVDIGKKRHDEVFNVKEGAK